MPLSKRAKKAQADKEANRLRKQTVRAEKKAKSSVGVTTDLAGSNNTNSNTISRTNVCVVAMYVCYVCVVLCFACLPFAVP
jgi:hypothetical protein